MINIAELSGRPKDKLVQKVLDVGKANSKKLKFPMLFSEKVDGVYCLAMRDDDFINIYSRTGEQYTSMKHIESMLGDVMDDDDIVIFEAYEIGKEQSVISGHCRDTKNQFPDIIARCHQYLTVSEFVNGGTTTAQESYEALLDMMADTDISVIPQKLVHSLEEAMELTKEIWAGGGEGSVLVSPHGVFCGGKKNAEKVRIKQSVTYDLEVVGVLIGKKGKYEATLGKLVVRWKDGKTLPVSGMTDDQRHLWWNDPSIIIGSIIEVKAMTDSSKGSLREARFKSVRFDKVTADY